ncbi:hypothetical protein [Nocardia arthritidis]|uniref:Alpha/beta hydrolase n=1 Tax=Nocardia arthritidis TaxID=228602 RepID=A0A6G9Y699_9NOCA|nr:hypothetical protein [Nocardia arthritidis]QIS08768.1 hypothetical protein F5544_04270 [Nocardia arthritidis]
MLRVPTFQSLVRALRTRSGRPQPDRSLGGVLAGIDTRTRLGETTVPTRVIASGSDTAYPAERLRPVAAAIPGAQFHVIAYAPHLIALENATQLAD